MLRARHTLVGATHLCFACLVVGSEHFTKAGPATLAIYKWPIRYDWCWLRVRWTECIFHLRTFHLYHQQAGSQIRRTKLHVACKCSLGPRFAQEPTDTCNTTYTPLFPNVEGREDAGQTYPNSLLEVGGRLLVHAYAARGLHGSSTVATGMPSIVTYELRFDGFVYLAAHSGTHKASFTTHPVKWRGGDLLVNADAARMPAQNTVLVAVLDAATGEILPGYGATSSMAFVGKNETAQAWSWSDGRQTMGELAGKSVRFGVTLTGTTRLYSLRGKVDLLA